MRDRERNNRKDSNAEGSAAPLTDYLGSFRAGTTYESLSCHEGNLFSWVREFGASVIRRPPPQECRDFPSGNNDYEPDGVVPNSVSPMHCRPEAVESGFGGNPGASEAVTRLACTGRVTSCRGNLLGIH